MAKEFSYKFYHSKEWQEIRQYVLSRAFYVCEMCHQSKKILIVHHKIFLTPDNIDNPLITLNPDLLQVLCIDCHNAIHGYCNRQSSANKTSAIFDSNGNVIGKS